MSLLSWMRYIPFSVKDAAKISGTFKDAIADPADTSGSIVKSIVRRQPFILQRVIAVGLLVGAMLLGADIGIEYQKSQMPTPTPIMQTPLPPAQPMKLEMPEEIKEAPPNFTEPVVRTAPVEQIERREEPRVKPKAVQLEIRKSVSVSKSVSNRGSVRVTGKPEIFTGPFHFGSSGPGGY